MTREEINTMKKLWEVLDCASFNGLNAKKMLENAIKIQMAAAVLREYEVKLTAPQESK